MEGLIKLTALFFFTLCLFINAGPPPGYYDSAIGKSGVALRNAVHEIINDHAVIRYSGGITNTEVALKVLDEDPANTNNVFLLYKQSFDSKTNFGTSTGWNREHIWPNSYGLDDVPPDFTDLLNLRAEDANVNSSRGNKLYDISSTNDSNYKYPAHIEASLCSSDTDSWEPPAVVKGDIARALFYMDVRYEGDRTNEVDLVLTDEITLINSSTNFMGKLSTLLLWNEEDPVSLDEMKRNDLIFERYQHNRNPFIDHPEWVNLIFAPAFTNAPQLNVSCVSNQVTLQWLATNQTTQLEFTTNLFGNWMNVTNTPILSNGKFSVSVNREMSLSFFRLRVF